MTPFFRLRLVRAATLAGLLAAVAVSGCGRKGALEPPPGASISDPAVVAQPATEIGPDGRPVPRAQSPRQRTPIDWLID